MYILVYYQPIYNYLKQKVTTTKQLDVFAVHGNYTMLCYAKQIIQECSFSSKTSTI